MRRNSGGAELAIGGALYAAAEIALTLSIGGFAAWGRAEALLFLAFRPWCLLGLGLAARRRPAAFRLALYASGLVLASAAEAVLLLRLGAVDPAPALLRGLAAGALLIVPVELLLFAGRALFDRERGAGARVATAALTLVLAAAGGGAILRAYDSILLPAAETPVQRPPLMLLTGLPVIWGERALAGPEPNAFYRSLSREFAIRPLDTLDTEALAGGRLLLVAQPRRLAPLELVALDDWVRDGGRVLVLTDPVLLWPSALPLGDARRAPPVGLLTPLLDHWGLTLSPAEERGAVVRYLGGRRLSSAAEGRFTARSPNCRVEGAGFLARCRIGEGQALLVADADLLHDGLWTAPGEGGAARHGRLADNPLIVAAWLDELAGRTRPRAAGEVAWRDPDAPLTAAILPAGLLILLVGGAGAILRIRRRTT